MKAVNDLDFLSLFWAEAKAVGQRVLKDLPNCATPNIGNGKQLMYIVNFSDISGQSWGVKEILTRVMGQSVTLKILANKINYMILEGRANDVKPMLEKICTGRIKSLSHPKNKKYDNIPNITAEYLGKGHFRWNYQAHTLNEAEIRRIKEYFNIRTNTEIKTKYVKPMFQIAEGLL